MSKNKVLVKVHPEGRYVVGLDKSIDINKVTVGARVALRNDSYSLHVLLPTKVRGAVSEPPYVQPVCLSSQPQAVCSARMPEPADWLSLVPS